MHQFASFVQSLHKEMRKSDYFYSYSVATAHFKREIGKKDKKKYIQLPRENNVYLLSDDLHKIFHILCHSKIPGIKNNFIAVEGATFQNTKS